MGWGKGSVHHCRQIRTYEEAEKHFNERGPVKSKRWKSHERPLVSTSEVWFKNVQGPGPDGGQAQYYSLCCGREVETIRLWKPEPDGTYRVWINNEGSRWVQQFIRFMGFFGPFIAEHTAQVLVPLNYDTDEPYCTIPKGWSACLTFNNEHSLILEKSDHRPYYIRRSSKQDKEARKRVLGLLNSTLDLLMVRLPTFHEESMVSRMRGCAFGGTDNRGAAEQVGEAISKLCTHGAVPTDDILSSLLPHAQEVYNVALSKKDYAGQSWNIGWANTPGHPLPRLPEHAFRAALKRSLLRWSGLNRPHQDIELPKFPFKLPNRYFFRKIGK